MGNAKYQNELDTPYVEAELIYLLDTGEKPVNYPSVAGGRAERGTGLAATVHNDYTERSANQRLRDILPDEADELLKRRFAIVNAWRSIAGPVYTSPVALCDGRSVAPADMIVTERRGIAETYRIAYNAAWFTIRSSNATKPSDQDPRERDGRCRFAPHAAFMNPAAPSGAPPRESVESRAFAFFSAAGQ